jgi:hypothetical protein
VAWEQVIARLATIRAGFELGRWSETEPLARQLRDVAVERGDLYGEVVGATYLSDARLAAGDVEGARALVERVRVRWPFEGVHMQHVYVERALATCALMTGDAAEARTRVEAVWPGLRRSGLLNVPLIHFDMWELRARVALSVGEDPRAAIKALAGQATHHSQTQARFLGALRDGGSDPDGAAQTLTAVSRAFEGRGMRSRAALARRAAGVLRGSASEMAEADAALATHGIPVPGPWAMAHAPLRTVPAD